MNSFIEYYGKYEISPVKQDISDINIHYKKREKLYRQLGMPPIVFQNANILEVGPGSGYNTLAFFRWGAKVDLVEPNPTGIKDMKLLFSEKGISEARYQIYETMIEKFQNPCFYNVIIAEGFLHAIDNAKEIIQKLKGMLNSGGVIVVTCMDEMSMFVEQIKRLVCQYLTFDIKTYEEKVRFCTNLFQQQFLHLNGKSRTVEDWVKDDMLNPAFNNKVILDFKEAIQTFGQEFYVLGSSQKIFTDYSWYKDLEYEENENCIQQFLEKQHTFLMTGMKESKLDQTEQKYLKKQILQVREKCILFEENYSKDIIEEIIELLCSIKQTADFMNTKFYNFVIESVKILQELKSERNIDLSAYHTFYNAVGRTQQYLSMVKKYEY